MATVLKQHTATKILVKVFFFIKTQNSGRLGRRSFTPYVTKTILPVIAVDA